MAFIDFMINDLSSDFTRHIFNVRIGNQEQNTLANHFLPSCPTIRIIYSQFTILRHNLELKIIFNQKLFLRVFKTWIISFWL